MAWAENGVIGNFLLWGVNLVHGARYRLICGDNGVIIFCYGGSIWCTVKAGPLMGSIIPILNIWMDRHTVRCNENE